MSEGFEPFIKGLYDAAPKCKECGEMREYWDDELCVKCRKKKEAEGMKIDTNFTDDEKKAIIRVMDIIKEVSAEVVKAPENFSAVLTQMSCLTEEDKQLLTVYGLLCYNQKKVFEGDVKE